MILEAIDGYSFNVNASEEHVSVMLMGPARAHGVVSIDLVVGDDEYGNDGVFWWVARAVVNPPSRRGCGIGTIMLKRALQEIAKSQHKRVQVMPSGYGADPVKQMNFYLKNGFRAVDGVEGLLQWVAE
jgi:hypothetical protein